MRLVSGPFCGRNTYDTTQRRGKIGSAMQLYKWDQVEKEQLSPTFARQVIHGDKLTVARVYLRKGCVVPEHSHHNEQISMMEEGRLKFVIGGVEKVLAAGEVVRIPPNVPHSAEALDDCVAVDIFSPPREDWKSGDDAYLRGK
jgi:quercetin dioxygenase-like cupin family protein